MAMVTSYRYNASGQRIYKKTGTAAAEHYILDGSVTVRFYKEDGTAHWNILAGGAVVGSYPSSGGARYYYRDHLGSTRAVINSSGTITEAHDYYVFGLLMPGRSTAGAAVKEKYTGKERDAETGLDYFGARYYMAALGRWTSVDPLADDYPGWSPYNYVLGNPVRLFDPDGEAPCCLGGGQIALMIQHARALLGDKQAQQELKAAYKEVGRTALEVAADTPGDAFELVTGRTVTLREGNRGTAAAALLIPFASSRILRAVDDLAAGGGSPGRLGSIVDTGSSSRVVGFTQRSLQKGFTKHGADFGLSGNWNPSRAADFSRAVNQHINSQGVVAISGSYRGQSGFTHYLDPNTRLNVVVDSHGNFVTGYRLSEDQLNDVVNSGHLW